MVGVGGRLRAEVPVVPGAAGVDGARPGNHGHVPGRLQFLVKLAEESTQD